MGPLAALPPDTPPAKTNNKKSVADATAEIVRALGKGTKHDSSGKPKAFAKAAAKAKTKAAAKPKAKGNGNGH